MGFLQRPWHKTGQYSNESRVGGRHACPLLVILNTIMTLFKDRALIAAIFISIFWHFLCIFLFNPTLSTGNIREYKTSIAFLGDILGNVISGNENPFTPSGVSPERIMDKTDPVEAGFINTHQEKKDFSYSLADNRGSLNLGAYRKKEITRVNFSDFFIKGDAKDRIIMYKPDLDNVAMLPSDFNSDFSASIGFKISKDTNPAFSARFKIEDFK